MDMIHDLFDMKHSRVRDLFRHAKYPWEVLRCLDEFILMEGRHTYEDEYKEVAHMVWVHKTAYVAPTACIEGPCLIGPKTEIRHGAYIRGNVLIGEGCVVGNSTELKNCVLFDGVQVPHFNYVGDSVLGYKAHLGAGAVISNVRGDKENVVIDGIPTERKKVGAFVGDFAEIGCNAVINPGTVIGRNAQIYPTSCVRGIVPEGHIFKNDGTIVKKNLKGNVEN